MTQKVFFLGAGFSKAVNDNYPLMDDLTEKVLSRLEKESVREHLNEIPPQVKQNIESLLTYLSTDFPWKTETTKYANLALYSSIIKILSDIFVEYAHQEHSPSQISTIGANFAKGVLYNSSSYNFITLNYDVLLEELLLSVRKQQSPREFVSYPDVYPYPIEWIGNRKTSSGRFWGIEKKSYPPRPKILKLHGSANWFWAGISQSDVLYYRNWNRNEEDDMNKGLKPYIIPPVLDKSSFYNHIAIHDLWQQAEELLKKADEIYIIGFSFPQTDLSVRYLFQSALRNSEPDIYVVNKAHEDELRPTYRDVLQGQCVDYEYTGSYDVVERFTREVILMEGHQ